MSRGARIFPVCGDIEEDHGFLDSFRYYSIGRERNVRRSYSIFFRGYDNNNLLYPQTHETGLCSCRYVNLSPILFLTFTMGGIVYVINVTKHTSVRAISHWGERRDRLLFIISHICLIFKSLI